MVDDFGNIYNRINLISQEAGALKPEKSGGVPFPFRGIDGTVNHLSPLLRKYGVIYLPKVTSHKVSSREVGTKTVTQSEIETTFTFVAPDGSSVEVTTAGLAQDFADRSAAQAQSVALRVALLQLFALPTQTKEPEETGQIVQDGSEKEKADVAAKAPQTPAKPTVAALKAQIGTFIKGGTNQATGEVTDPIAGPILNDYADKKFGSRDVWFTDATKLGVLLDDLRAGKVK